MNIGKKDELSGDRVHKVLGLGTSVSAEQPPEPLSRWILGDGQKWTLHVTGFSRITTSNSSC